MPICLGSLDLDRFSQHREVNYLHSGDVLDEWILDQDVVRVRKNLEARANHENHLETKNTLPQRCSPVRRSGKERGWRLDEDRLAQSLGESLDWRDQFHRLGCRGFSYQLDIGMSNYDSLRPPTGHLSPRIDFRLALMPSRELFYPFGVWRYFNSRRWRDNHYYHSGVPSIAFCFGRTIGRTWYILNMQSDLSSSAPSAVREHFRGWRTILFANIVAQAKGRAERIRICPANDVVRSCYPGTREKTSGPSARWKSIYDGTAMDWQMRAVTSCADVNIQLYKGRRPVYAQRFYQLSLRETQMARRDNIGSRAASQGDRMSRESGLEKIFDGRKVGKGARC